MSVRQFITLLGLASLLGSGLIAQEFRATVSGLVTDPSGGGIPAAKVTLKNLATNEEQSQNTSEAGEYSIPFLNPGNYSIRVEAKGFRAAVRELVEVHTNDKLAINFALTVGSGPGHPDRYCRRPAARNRHCHP